MKMWNGKSVLHFTDDLITSLHIGGVFFKITVASLVEHSRKRSSLILSTAVSTFII